MYSKMVPFVTSSCIAPLLALALLPAQVSTFVLSSSPHQNFGSRRASSSTSNTDFVADTTWHKWAKDNRIETPKLSIRKPLADERGKGGVYATEKIAALEVLMRIPLHMILSTKEKSWAASLTAAALTKDSAWVNSWKAGGWATDPLDLGECAWGSEGVTGSLLATGSDNDANIFAKFRFPCHPVVHRSGVGLAALTDHDEKEALQALMERGRVFRSMRDGLIPLVNNPTDRGKGSLRDRRSWDVADALSRILSRATTVEMNSITSYCVVPLHERLDHASVPNSKLVCMNDHEICLVATRDITDGESITRNYFSAPRLDGDKSEGALRLLLQFGLPPNAWKK